MSMDFGFEKMAQAEAFVRAVGERYGLGGQTFVFLPATGDDDDDLPPAAAHIDRVEIPEDGFGLAALKLRFALTEPMMAATRAEESYDHGEDIYTSVAAERVIEALAVEFEGRFLGT